MTNNFNQSSPYIGNAQQQFPYGNSSLLMNTPYDNYMGRQNQQQIFNQNQYLKCRPVASKDEAKAFQIDLDGSLWVFTDVGNEKIYTKQINTDGTATFKTYSFVEDENPYATTEYVTKDEFNKAIQNLMAAMQTEKSQNLVPASNNNTNGQSALISF